MYESMSVSVISAIKCFATNLKQNTWIQKRTLNVKIIINDKSNKRLEREENTVF